jgi:signal transduction histidine kinase
MASAHYTLTPQLLIQVFPFHIGFDRSLAIVQLGVVLQRIHPMSTVGDRLDQHFRLQRPTIQFEFTEFQKKARSLFILESRHNLLQLKGQMVFLDDQEIGFFLCSVCVPDSGTLVQLGIKLKDFALHDTTVDFLGLRQTSQMALEESGKLAQSLFQEKSQLQLALQIQAKLTETAESQTKKLEQALRELHDTQARLIHAEKMSSLGQLVAGLAHEINNPTNFIYGNLTHARCYVESLLELIQLYQEYYPQPVTAITQALEEIDLAFLKSDFQRLLQSMQSGTERIRSIITSLRLFSRLDEAEIKSVDIHEGIDSALMMLSDRLRTRPNCPEIKVIKKYQQLPLVECYAGQLNQVFFNILINTIDALEEKVKMEQTTSNSFSFSPTITIRTQNLASSWIKICIVDNGIGMNDLTQQQIFDPFFTTKPVGQGTGMGLSVSYQIITKQHHGKIVCHSKPGEGTEFIIEIPVQQSDFAKIQNQRSA